MSLVYYVIDTETTGLEAGYNEVTEISIVRCLDRNQLTKQIRAEFPERASDIALEVTNRTFEDLLEGESKEDAVAACEAFFAQDGKTPEHRCIVAHNAPFDKRFCHALWESCGKSFPAIVWMDTIALVKVWAKKIGQQPKNHKLGTVLKFANITAMPGAHDAGSDARNTYLLWKKGMGENIDYLSATRRYPHNVAGQSKMEIDMADVM
jgi:DNA polymerase III epsilon subunit-like protein